MFFTERRGKNTPTFLFPHLVSKLKRQVRTFRYLWVAEPTLRAVLNVWLSHSTWCLGIILTHVWFFAGAFISIVQKDPHSKLRRMRNMIASWEKPRAQRVEWALTFGHTANGRILFKISNSKGKCCHRHTSLGTRTPFFCGRLDRACRCVLCFVLFCL